MAFLASNLVQNIYDELGQVDPTFGLFNATGGSATTFINTNFANYENPPETDAFKNYLAIVVRDAGGASASPEGKWALVSAYADSTQTGTVATVTDAIASGDTIMLAKQDKFPLQQVLFAINRGLEFIGDVPENVNTSLTTVANQTEYSIPVAVKRGLKQVWIQGRTNDSNDNQWYPIYGFRRDPATGGTADTIYLPQLPQDRTIRLVYDGIHPTVSAYSDYINDYIHPKIAVSACIIKLLEWYNRQDANQDAQSYFLWLENEYRNRHLPMALAEHPIQKPRKHPKYAIFGKQIVDGVPEPIS